MHLLLHPSSPPCCKSELDLFTVAPTQTSINESGFISINPIHAITNTDVPLEFNVPGSSDQYIDPSNVFLYLKTKFVKEDGSDLNDNEHIVYPETNFLYTCFSSMELFLNETSLGTSAASYPYRNYIENLLNYSDDAKQSHLQSCGFYSLKDSAKHLEKATKSKNNTYEYYGRLNGNILSQERLILPGVDVHIKLTRSPPQFALNVESSDGHANLPPKPIFKLMDAYLYVRKVKLTPQRHMEIEQNLLTTNAKYPIKRIETKVFNYTQGLSNINIPNIVNGNLPQKVIIGIIEHKAYSGDYTKSPFKFQHFGLRSVSLNVNGQPIGRKYEMMYDGAHSLSSRPFYDLIAHTVSCSDAGTGIDLESYAENSNLYAFDLTPDLAACSPDHLNAVKKGTLGVDLTFKTTLQNPISVFLYMENSQIIEVDRTRNILLNY